MLTVCFQEFEGSVENEKSCFVIFSSICSDKRKMPLNPVKVIKSPDTYFETLTGEVGKRYLEKIKIINNYDPFMMKAHELTISGNLEE